MCPGLDAPENGGVSVPSTSYLSEATYTCDDGFIIDGIATRQCGPDEMWLGNEPSCVRKSMKAICEYDSKPKHYLYMHVEPL